MWPSYTAAEGRTGVIAENRERTEGSLNGSKTVKYRPVVRKPLHVGEELLASQQNGRDLGAAGPSEDLPNGG